MKIQVCRMDNLNNVKIVLNIPDYETSGITEGSGGFEKGRYFRLTPEGVDNLIKTLQKIKADMFAINYGRVEGQKRDASDRYPRVTYDFKND